jgi:hypothetical protein
MPIHHNHSSLFLHFCLQFPIHRTFHEISFAARCASN